MKQITKLLGSRLYGAMSTGPSDQMGRAKPGRTAQATTRTEHRDTAPLAWTVSADADNDFVVGTVPSLSLAESTSFEILSGNTDSVLAIDSDTGVVIVDDEEVLVEGTLNLVVRETVVIAGFTYLVETPITLVVS